jgi:hypothetical protein
VLPVAVVIGTALVVDYAAVAYAFGLTRRGSLMVTAMHYALTVIISFVIQSSLAIYQTAPG